MDQSEEPRLSISRRSRITLGVILVLFIPSGFAFLPFPFLHYPVTIFFLLLLLLLLLLLFREISLLLETFNSQDHLHMF